MEGMFKNEDNIKAVQIGDVVYINTTPHDITLDYKGEAVNVVQSGIIINAYPMEMPVKVENGIEFVETVFSDSHEGRMAIERIKKAYPEPRVIIGSIIAAQAYPGEVVAMVPAPGFERVPPEQKRMRYNKFIMF